MLPEAAGILFGGGFPRGDSAAMRRAAQRAIFHTQHELEATADAGDAPYVLCDRGTVDGLAYWPGPGDFWAEVGTLLATQLARYDAVLHIESAAEAAAIDERILAAWSGHPRRIVIPAAPDFLAKAGRALAELAELLPCCCGDALKVIGRAA